MTFENQSIAGVCDPSIHSLQDSTRSLRSITNAGDLYAKSYGSGDIEGRETVRIILPKYIAAVLSKLENLYHQAN